MSSREELSAQISLCEELKADVVSEEDHFIIEQKRLDLVKRLNFLNTFKIGKGYDTTEKLDTGDISNNSSK